MEQLAIWDPAVILFGPDSIYDTVGSGCGLRRPVRRQERLLLQGARHAVELAEQPADGEPGAGHAVAAAPAVPRAVRQRPVQDGRRLLKTFYGYDLSESEFNEIAANAQPKA
ncbi:MAG: hypothetical protein ACLTMP_04425 [Eggerthella lenta]